MPYYRPKTTWRDYYNPLPSLTLASLAAMEDMAARGEFADLQWFWYHMEQKDVTIQAAISRRLSFVDSLDWQIKAVETADPALAEEQRGFLQYAYNRITNLKEATKHLAKAVFVGYQHCEKIANGYGGLITRLDCIDPWYWCRDGRNGVWRFNATAAPSAQRTAEAVDTTRLITMQAAPLNIALSRLFFQKLLCVADWDTALEIGALPNIFAVAPPGKDTAEQLAEFQTIADAVVSNGRGALLNGTEIKTVDLGERSRLPYVERIKYIDEQIVLAATGGKLTMLTESGSGTLAGGAHSDSLLSLAQSDASMLSEAFQRQGDLPLLSKFYPGKPIAAYFEFGIPQALNVAQLLEAVANLSWANMTVDPAWLAEKTGMKILPLERPPQ